MIDWKAIATKLINFKTEPVRAVARITSAVGGLAALLALWGIPMSDATQTALISTAGTLVPLMNVAAEVMRSFVTPVPTAHEAIKEALAGPAVVASPKDMNRLSKQMLQSASERA